MTNSEVCAVLNDLIQLDYDAIIAYTQAIDQIHIPAERDQLMVYQNDHVRHTMNLSDIVRRLGQDPHERDDRTMELVTEDFTVVGKAMHDNEKLVNRKYRQCAAMPMPTDIRAQVEMNYHDEQRHLSYIEMKLAQKIPAGSI